MTEDNQANFNIKFVVPPESLVEQARIRLTSDDSDQRIACKAILDATDIAMKTRDAFVRKDENVDVGPYFDHWFGDSIEAAQRLLQSSDPISRNLGSALIALEQDILKSKEEFLIEVKRIRDLDNE